MDLLMTEQLVRVFKRLAALMEETRVLVARDLVLQDVWVVLGGKYYLDRRLVPVTFFN